jgi:MFS family permease
VSPLTGNEDPDVGGASTRPVVTTLVLCGVQFVDVLGVTVVLTALPRILDDLGGTTSEGTVIATAYSLFFGGLLMVASRLGDRVGHRRVLLGALALFCVGSLPGALAGSVWVLAAARALQGVAAAASVPAALRLLTTMIPDGVQRRRAVAAWSAAGATAGAAGFVVGGVLTELASWRLLFWLNIAVAAVLTVGLLAVIPRDRPRQESVRMGWGSGLLLTAGVMGVVLGATLLGEEGQELLATIPIGAGVLAIVGFLALERRSSHPLVPVEARRASGLRWGAFGSFMNTATTSSSFTVATVYLQSHLGLSPLQTASLLVSLSVMVVTGSTQAPRLLAAHGQRATLATGLAVITIGNLLLAAWPRPIGIGVAAATSGLGLGIASVAATEWGTRVSDNIKTAASGIINTAAQLGTALGTAVIVLAATVLGPRPAWLLAALLAATATLATIRGNRRPAATEPT